MLKEYALDPACLSNWASFRYLIDNFGVSRGRLISEYPKHWRRLVFDSCLGFSFRQKQTLTEELKRLKNHGLCKTSRQYDGNLKWLQNAIAQQRVFPFHAIIAMESNPEYKVLNSEELSKAEPLWAVKREDKIARTREALRTAAAKLLHLSDRILFVDKMFDPEIPRWKDLLIDLIRTALMGRSDMPIFEYHTKIDNDEFAKPTAQRTRDFQEICKKELGPGMPTGSTLKIYRWDQKPMGDFFHARYILTEKGGLRIDWGLDSGKPGETTDVSLLDDALWREYWGWFQEESPVLELIDFVVIDSTS